MRSPFKVSLVACSGVFLAALLAGLFHHNTINGRVLTALEQLPAALIGAVFFAALALFGTWLGLRSARRVTYVAGMSISVVYVAATFLANLFFYTEPRTVTFPSREAEVYGLEVLVIGAVWGVGAPYLIALLFSRFKSAAPNGA